MSAPMQWRKGTITMWRLDRERGVVQLDADKRLLDLSAISLDGITSTPHVNMRVEVMLTADESRIMKARELAAEWTV